MTMTKAEQTRMDGLERNLTMREDDITELRERMAVLDQERFRLFHENERLRRENLELRRENDQQSGWINCHMGRQPNGQTWTADKTLAESDVRHAVSDVNLEGRRMRPMGDEVGS